MSEAKPEWPPIRCTRCKTGEVYIEMISVGSWYIQQDVIDCISCQRCGAEWDSDGTPKPPIWLAELPHGWTDEVPTKPGWYWWAFMDRTKENYWIVDLIELQETQNGTLQTWGAYSHPLDEFVRSMTTHGYPPVWRPLEEPVPPGPPKSMFN